MPAENISPGRRDCHDAQSSVHFRVDFVYPVAQPQPIALEITGLTFGPDIAGATAADDLAERLSKIAEREELGSWLVTVRTDQKLGPLEQEILKMIRDAQPDRERLLQTDDQIRPGHYTSDDLFRLPNQRARAAFAAEHKRLKTMGLEEVKPVRSDREHVIGVFPITGWREIGGFGELLLGAVAENADKLGEVPGYERHLGVLVDRFDASTHPALTDPPELPGEVDVLWVVHRWRHSGDFLTVWVLRRGDEEWRVYAA